MFRKIAMLAAGLALSAAVTYSAAAEQVHVTGVSGSGSTFNPTQIKVRDTDGNEVTNGVKVKTNPDGTSTVTLPPGDYTIETWREEQVGPGTSEMNKGTIKVKVKPGQTGKKAKKVHVTLKPQTTKERIDDHKQWIADLGSRMKGLKTLIKAAERVGDWDQADKYEARLKDMKTRLKQLKAELEKLEKLLKEEEAAKKKTASVDQLRVGGRVSQIVSRTISTQTLIKSQTRTPQPVHHWH